MSKTTNLLKSIPSSRGAELEELPMIGRKKNSRRRKSGEPTPNSTNMTIITKSSQIRTKSDNLLKLEHQRPQLSHQMTPTTRSTPKPTKHFATIKTRLEDTNIKLCKERRSSGRTLGSLKTESPKFALLYYRGKDIQTKVKRTIFTVSIYQRRFYDLEANSRRVVRKPLQWEVVGNQNKKSTDTCGPPSQTTANNLCSDAINANDMHP